ncbi:MAG TPA: TIGR03767 family metallophosphoesterase [Streptosporangiaceae bacterium]
MSAGHPHPRPHLTTERRLGPGPVLRRGLVAPYRAVQLGPGEPHLVRADLGGVSADPPVAGPVARPGRPLLSLVHVTDLQLADVQSPARFEFLNREYADPRYAALVPTQRPQEALTAHAVDAMLRTVNAAQGPATGMPVQLAVTTGDAIDNAQWNEVLNFLALFDGGPVRQNSGGARYEGVQALDWPDDIFWKPDGVGPAGPDVFRSSYGFPNHPGLLKRALGEFSAAGLRVPWLSCFGNHEALIQGLGVPSPELARSLVGGSKPLRLPDDLDASKAVQQFTEQPEAFMAGPSRLVTADPARRPVTRREFVEAHFRPGARPAGHGFTQQNRRDGTAYYVHDTPAVRLIALDTNCLQGGAAGCLDRDQARWLEDQLAEVHSAYQGRGGSQIRTGHQDRLVVLFSHHGIDTLTSGTIGHAGPDGEPLIGAGELTALLHRYPNVVLWLNGHTHINAVRARRGPADSEGPAGGFWEVTTCAIVDWPCQARLVELIDSGGCLSVVCTMVDHDTPAAVADPRTSAELASLHRELAANVPFAGHGSATAGTTADRNVELRIPAPFPLRRLPAGLA